MQREKKKKEKKNRKRKHTLHFFFFLSKFFMKFLFRFDDETTEFLSSKFPKKKKN